MREPDSSKSAPGALDQLTTDLTTAPKPSAKTTPARKTPAKKTPAKAPAARPDAPAGIPGLDPTLGGGLAALIAAAPGKITISSGRRTRAEQQRLYDLYVSGHGALAAKPGTSRHESGLAADLHFADDATREWARANAGRFGLTFPVAGESWHVEPVGAKGGTPGDGGGDLPADQGLPPDASPQQIKDEVARKYGYASAFLNMPEVGKILLDAARGGWDKATLQGALSQTDWWKKTTATAREWDALNLTDHATAKNQVEQQIALLGATAQKSGIRIDPLRLHDIAVNSLRLGWNPQQTTDALMHEGKLDVSGSRPSDALATMQSLKQVAAQYHIPLSETTLNKWTQDIIGGKSTEKGFGAYIQQQATSLYPWMADHIQRGGTVEQWADPYREKAGQLLEIDPLSVDFNQPKFSRALSQVDPATGTRGPMSLSAWDTYLRTLPEYNKTRQATDQAAQFAKSLTEQFAKAAF